MPMRGTGEWMRSPVARSGDPVDIGFFPQHKFEAHMLTLQQAEAVIARAPVRVRARLRRTARRLADASFAAWRTASVQDTPRPPRHHDRSHDLLRRMNLGRA